MSDALSTLIGRMTPACRGATARAANLCVARGHHEIDLEHLLLAMLDTPACDVVLLLERLDVSLERIRRDAAQGLDRLPGGHAGTPVFASRMHPLFEHAHLEASAPDVDHPIRTGHIFLSLLRNDAWRMSLEAMSPALVQLKASRVQSLLAELGPQSSECRREQGTPDAPAHVRVPGNDALARYTVNLTERARNGRIDPVVGRERETLQLINVLCRRRQNNPILLGDAGVGKTAVVEGLAMAVARGQVPDSLAGVELHCLDMGLLQAGASVKGEFEARLRDLLAEVASSDHPIILFVDEAHTLIGAGGAAGQGDAANLLKPALARGELRTIAATTWAEYKRYVEKDAALSRRFQPVTIAEPDQATAEDMLRAMVPGLEQHSGVRVLDEAVRAAVALSSRYITDRQLPDKAIALLDTAVARVMLTRSQPHPELVIDEALLDRARGRLRSIGRDGDDRDSGTRGLDEATALVNRLVDSISGKRDSLALEQRLIHAVEVAACDQTKKNAMRQLVQAQGHAPLLPRQVNADVVAAVTSDWTGVPLTRLTKGDAEALRHLGDRLAKRVIGQEHATRAIAGHVRTTRSGLGDPRRPQGVFLLVGPSGVGKTETALALAEAITGNEGKLITVNMSEYQEAHSVSGLKGSPAGYVGYGEGGTLTESIRRQPYSVLLLDEVEKAHPDVLELFYQVFDRGYMADAEGREIDFRHATILLTSNVGSGTVMQACLNPGDNALPDAAALLDLLRPALYQAFKPAFLGRMTVVPYYPLDDDVLEAIIRGRLDALGTRLFASHGLQLVCAKPVISWVLGRCKEADAGARDAIRIIEGEVAGAVAAAVLAGEVIRGGTSELRLSVAKDGALLCKPVRVRALETGHV